MRKFRRWGRGLKAQEVKLLLRGLVMRKEL